MSSHESPVSCGVFPRCGQVLPIGAVLAQLLRRYEMALPVDHGTPVPSAGACVPVPIVVQPVVATTSAE